MSLIVPYPAASQTPVKADVVVVVDTSTSMKQPEMDPQRTSVLVTRLFADIVPGDLAVVRLLDIGKDRDLIPSRDTGVEMQCSEDPTKRCHRVDAAGDWYGDARSKRYGVLARSSRGDVGFKQELERHLAPDINNSIFGLAFRGAQGVFDAHGSAQGPRMVIWLSDGNTDDPQQLSQVVQELAQAGVMIQPVVFGQGKTVLADNMGLAPKQVRNPAELIKAFADSFRKIVQAPYEVDNPVAVQPKFEIKPKVDEAWVVVYGDDSLGDVTIDGPEGPKPADYAQDRRQGAGAYKVLHLNNPTAGIWSVRAVGGGAAAYAVIQRSGVVPIFLEPQTAVVGVPVSLVAGVGSERGGNSILPVQDIPTDTTLEAEVMGQRVQLADNGHDGRYSAPVTFNTIGQVPVIIRLKSTLVDRTVRAEVSVTGMFRATGGPIEINLGDFKAPTESCQNFRLHGDQRGVIPFEIAALRDLPSGYRFELRQSRGAFRPGGPKMPLGPDEELRLCLMTTSRAPSSTASGEHWLDLRVAGSNAADAVVPLHIRWHVTGLTWWERWRWLIISLLILLLFIFWIYGYIRPKRFSRSMAVTFVPELVDIEQTPQPVMQWPGVGIRWYRNARACLHPSFRLNRTMAGAIAVLDAVDGGTQVSPANGHSLYRRTIEDNWEPIAAAGRRSTVGEVYRISENGPYFRISVRRL